jgi:putative toxin-antitoxin system antitoxin component (TIGR02293 family)
MVEVQYQNPTFSEVPGYLQEPQTLFLTETAAPLFDLARLDRLQATIGFSQAEWATIINVSLKTLQRYQKEGRPFDGLQAEHLQQIEQLIALGLSVFADAKALEAWLRRSKQVLGKSIDFSALQSFWGTRLLFDELGRMVHGIYI